ncbi:hypothetical protein R3P38DRAFT_2646900 [Favolaschia claudopus]|uniref:Cyanovirin-N domain-containing protein n=1 Tax=Favolaschia claudopus TaxID=2862362 RepID=A0AAW0AAR5_9AGAR
MHFFQTLTSFILASTCIGAAHALAVPDNNNALALRSPGELEARSNAAATCTLWTLIPNTANLRASCDTVDHKPHLTEIPISNCVANRNGGLACQKNGGAGGSCVFYDIKFGSTFFAISAHCKDDKGEIVTTVNFDMNQCFSNENGNLTC